MENIKECFTVREANKLMEEGYILFNTHSLSNNIIVYIMTKKTK